MRISSLVLALLLAGCGGSEPEGDTAIVNQVAATADEDGRIDCAPGESAFAKVCLLERAKTAEGTMLTLRQPDGGFHRLRMVDDGRGVIAADGAEPAKVTVLDDKGIEVAIGGARYRLPARVGPLAR